MARNNRLIDYYLPPSDQEGFVLESLIATTYQVDFQFVEEELLPVAFGVRSPISREKAFRSELERKLQKAEVSILYDLKACEKLARLSPRIDVIPISARKLHSKISLMMWVREDRTGSGITDRKIRLIVGSANLTRQGFRENYECVVSVDYGEKETSSGLLLTQAIALIQEIAAESKSRQLTRQLEAFVTQASLLPDGTTGADDPAALVAASDVVRTVRETWSAISTKVPETVTVVSPFWPEGSTAAEALAELFQELGPPANLELVCCGEKAADSKKWLPIFDNTVAMELKKRINSRLFLRAARPDIGEQHHSDGTDEIGDDTEDKELSARLGNENHHPSDNQRTLHAKLILMDGKAGSVLYAGSSNCTRRGLNLGGPSNFEAGFVYRLTPSQRKKLSVLLEFAGPAFEVQTNHPPATVSPAVKEEPFDVPTFIADVIATGTMITVYFRDRVPSDLVLLMPILSIDGDAGYWLLFKADPSNVNSTETMTLDLKTCQKCDNLLQPLPNDLSGQQIQPHVHIEVRWSCHSAIFPVRFDDKTQLPLHLVGRKPSEGELINYYLFGTEPDDWDDLSKSQRNETKRQKAETSIDTSGILAYFIRRFVQAIRGIEEEIRIAGYCRASLDAALRGPTSPLQLAESAFSSLTRPPISNEPQKTATAVGFQLTEILAAMIRSKTVVSDPELQTCFDPVISRCREMLNSLVAEKTELQAQSFRLYQTRILGDS